MQWKYIILLILLPITINAQKNISFQIDYKFTVTSDTTLIKLVCAIPQNVPGKQEIHDITFSNPPLREFEQYGVKYAEFLLSNIIEIQTITMVVDMTLFPYSLNDAIYKPMPVKEEDLEMYLLSEDYIESDDFEIVNVAKSLKKATTLETIESIYKFVSREITYDTSAVETMGAVYALGYRTGDCTEFATLFVALCRANNIPARVVDGLVTYPVKNPRHHWAEVYFDEYGWVTFEPTPGNIASFSTTRNQYIQFSHIFNDLFVKDFHFAAYWRVGGEVDFDMLFKILKQ